MAVLRGMAEEDARREEREIARVEAMSGEERRALLESCGVDVAKLRARTAALRARLAPVSLGDAPEPPAARGEAKAVPQAEERPSTVDADARPVVLVNPEPEPTITPLRRRPELTWIIAAAAATAVAGGAIAAAHYLHHDEPPTPEPPEDKHEPAPPAPKPEDPMALAASLREKARVACAAKEWTACLASLDAARDRDQAGDGAAEWRALREMAAAGIAREEKAARDGGS
jgi:hypothetical protein